MQKSLFLIIYLCLFSSLLQALPQFQYQLKPLSGDVTANSTKDLCEVARSTSEYLALGQAYDRLANHAGNMHSMTITIEQVQKTLAFICRIQQEDEKMQRSSRLHDLNFIQKHFSLIQWIPDKQQAQSYQNKKTLLKRLPDDQILLTKYYIKKAQASAEKTPERPFALYELPLDEQGLSLEQAQSRSTTLTRFAFSKQDILRGVLDQKRLAKPLLYLSREDLEDSLMQGTVVTQLKTGNNIVQERLFNVHRNNGYAYDRTRKKELQDRYWYFKETKNIMGYGKDAEHKILIKPAVTVAGDLALFGLGKLFMLGTEHQQGVKYRLVILADTGGAFEGNGYQLDLLSGYYKNWQEYHQEWSQFPDYASAYLLILKE